MNNCLSYQFLNLFCIFDRISAMLNQSELKLGWGKEENMVNSADDQKTIHFVHLFIHVLYFIYIWRDNMKLAAE